MGSAPRARVVIVGGGFAGLEAAKILGGADVDLTVIDRHNHHLFQPLLYQVATAGLGAPDISAPLRRILRGDPHTSVLMADVTGVERANRTLATTRSRLPYDYLVLATGATDSYFGHEEWRDHAPGLKTLDDALEIRRRILLAFERAEQETDEAAQRALLTFVIVGAGPTGVELAGAIAEMARHTLAGEFRRFDPRQARVILLDAADRVLPAYPPDLSAAARAQLERMCIEVRTGAAVEHIDAGGVDAGGQRIAARTVLWAAGVAASPLGTTLGVATDRAGRVLVEPDLSIPGDPRVFVVGDLAALRQQDGSPVPGVAPAAMQQGRHVARNVLRRIAGEPTAAFTYVDKGSLATIGRSAAVADVFGLHFSGLSAWLAWLFVHVLYLVGFRNRVSVMFDWAWAYVTYQRGARVIFPMRDVREPEAAAPSERAAS
jgi:NADH dehydrogenase